MMKAKVPDFRVEVKERESVFMKDSEAPVLRSSILSEVLSLMFARFHFLQCPAEVTDHR